MERNVASPAPAFVTCGPGKQYSARQRIIAAKPTFIRRSRIKKKYLRAIRVRAPDSSLTLVGPALIARSIILFNERFSTFFKLLKKSRLLRLLPSDHFSGRQAGQSLPWQGMKGSSVIVVIIGVTAGVFGFSGWWMVDGS